MKTNYLMLRDLMEVYKPKRRGFYTNEEVQLIANTLHLDEMKDEIQLRNLRDFVVLFFSLESQDKPNFENMDKMSAITCIIDNMLANMGCEV